MAYKYRAYTTDKKIVQGTLEATSESMAEAALYQAGYQRILSLSEAAPASSLATLIPSLFGIKTQDVIDFSGQLATLLESGLPVLTALQLLEGQAPKAAVKTIIAGIIEAIRAGNSLSSAFARYPHAFSKSYCQVIKAYEQTGNLEIGLKQMVSYIERQAATRNKIIRAMLYPSVVLLLAMGVVMLLITVALPPLVSLFTSLGADLPWMTRLLISMTGFINDYKMHLLGGFCGLAAATVYYARLPAGRRNLDSLLLKIPVIGTIYLERNMQQFCHLTSILLQAGLRLPRIMELVIQTMGNMTIRRAMLNVADKLVQGEGLSQPMAEDPLFPSLLVEMIIVGENTGTMDSTLATLAKYYEQRVDHRISILTAMIEPLMTMAIGLLVIFIALSMITPLYSILRSIH